MHIVKKNKRLVYRQYLNQLQHNQGHASDTYWNCQCYQNLIDIEPVYTAHNKITISQGGDIVANKSRSSGGSSGAFDNMKFEVANELGVSLNSDYNGDLTSRDAGRIGGTIVKKVFADYRNNNKQHE